MDWNNFFHPTFEQQTKGISILIKSIGIILISAIGFAFFQTGYSNDNLLAFCTILAITLLYWQIGAGLAKLQRFVIPIIISAGIIVIIFFLPNISALSLIFILGYLWHKREKFHGPWFKIKPTIIFLITAGFCIYIFFYKF